tara:strand:+ start:1115 stop:1318 length:204 start_codon:yes stop_codon:yes gene_type:complete
VGKLTPYFKGEFMIYLKATNGQIKQYKDHNTKPIDFLLGTGKWSRVKGLKDSTPYSTPKKASKKTSK